MIPAKTECPANWSMEYNGYLMSEGSFNKGRITYECIDKNPESIPEMNAANWEAGTAVFCHLEPQSLALPIQRKRSYRV